MTAPFLPSIAQIAKPPMIRPDFDDVGARELSAIPGRKGMPFFGILPEAVMDPYAFTRKMWERYGPVHRFYACGSWNLQLVGPEANEFVLFDEAKNFSSFGGWKPVFGRHFDGGLLLRDGANHQWHRKLIATAFKAEQLQAYLTIFARNIRRLVADWSGRIDDAYEMAQQLTFWNGYEAFLGRDAAHATRDDLLAFRYLMRSSTSVVTVPIPGNTEWRAVWAKKHVEGLIRPMLDQPVAEHRTDLLAVLCRMKAEGLLDDKEIVSHLMFVIAASFDALSSGTVSTLYYLAANPEWQPVIRDELIDGIADVEDMRLTDVQGCQVAERAVKEALRLNAAAPVLWRRAIKPFSFAGVSVPAGTITGINPMLTHLLPDIWEDPARYDPDRFAPEKVRARHRFAYVPFGAGAHGCLGANFAYLQVRALLRVILDGHQLHFRGAEAPRWYHWPNCRPRGALPIEVRPIARFFTLRRPATAKPEAKTCPHLAEAA